MALNFPSNPALNQQYTSGGKTWYWNGFAWNIVNPLTGLQPIIFNGSTNEISLGPVDGGTA